MKENAASQKTPGGPSSPHGTDFLLAAGLTCLLVKRANRKDCDRPADGDNRPLAAAAASKAIEVTAEPLTHTVAGPDFRLCLLTPYCSAPRQAAPAWRAALASAVVHGVSIAGLIAAGNSEVPQQQPAYHFEILHLRRATNPSAAGELWGKLHPATRAAVRAGSVAKGKAPQTLIVADAPAEAKLNEPIPAPWAVYIPRPVAVSDQPVQFSEPPQFAAGDNPALSAEIAFLSFPQRSELAPNASLIPKVSQVAGGDAIAGSDTARTIASAPETPEAKDRTNPARIIDMARRAFNELAASASAPHSKNETGTAPTSPADSAKELAGNETATLAADPAAVPAPNAVQAPTADVARIDLPADGRPRASVLVESPYMPGHIVATIYLKIGVPKDWTLEYWIPGGASALTAPWPYLMLRPQVKIPALAETLLVRGRLTAGGRLEELCLLGPGDFPDQDALFETLGQWKFRPASKNGNPVAVEILLAIPRQPDK